MYKEKVESFTSIPLRDGGRGTAIPANVGVLPLEFGAGTRPCLGGRAGTISPTSSNKSSPADKKVYNKGNQFFFLFLFFFFFANRFPLTKNNSSIYPYLPGVEVLWRLAGELGPVGVTIDPLPPNGAPPTGVDVLEWVGL